MPTDGPGDRDDADDDPWGRNESDGGWTHDDTGDDRRTDGSEWEDPPGVGGTSEPNRAGADGGGSIDPRAAARALGVGIGLSVATVVATLLVLLPAILLIQFYGVSLSPVANTLLTLALIQYVAFGSVIIGYTRYRDTTVRAYVSARVPSLRDLLAAIGGWVLALALAIALSVLVQILGITTGANSSAEAGLENPEIFLVLIPASFLVIGPMEELLFRGVVQGRLRETFSPVPAVIASAALFAAVHVIAITGGLAARINTIVILFFPSLVFGALYEYTDNLTVPALVHALYDATIFTILYVGAVYGPEGVESGTQALLALLW